MKKTALILLVACLVSLFTGHEAFGQMKRKQIKKNNKMMSRYRGRKSGFDEKIYNSVGVSLNSLNYYGDLAPTSKMFSTDFSLTQPAVGVSFTHRYGPRYQLTGSFTYGGIQGSDQKSADPNDQNAAFRYVRNLSFRNRIKELSILAQFDLFENDQSYILRVPWTPYAFVGVAVFHHNPQAQVPERDLLGNAFPDAGEWINLRPLQTEGKSYSSIQLGIPFGIGARFRLNDLMDIAVEFSVRYTLTDYLDDVSGNYVDLNTFGSNEKAKAMSYRSNEVQPVSPFVEEIIARRYTGYTGFTTVAGYGHENIGNIPNMRGNSDGRDVYMLTTIRLSYILGKTYNRAKFR
jgi:hypothetical protein